MEGWRGGRDRLEILGWTAGEVGGLRVEVWRGGVGEVRDLRLEGGRGWRFKGGGRERLEI